MAQTISSIPTWFRVGLEEIVELGAQDVRPDHAQFIGSTINSKQDYEKIGSLSPFGYALQTPEGTDATTDSLAQPFLRNFSTKRYALAFDVTKQANYTDFYNKVKNPARLLARAVAETIEVSAANIFNLGFTTPANGGTQTLDAAALFSTAHTSAGANQANTPTTALALNAVNVETGLAQMRTQKGHRGQPIRRAGPVKLITSYDQQALAFRICQSMNMAGTNENDTNEFLRSIVQPLPIFDITSATYWFLVTAEKQYNPLVRMNRMPLDIQSEYATKSGIWSFTVDQEWLFFAKEWRSTWGTNP